MLESVAFTISVLRQKCVYLPLAKLKFVKRCISASLCFLICVSVQAGNHGEDLSEKAKAKTSSWWHESSAAEGGELGVLRSPNDQRLYRYLQLDNKIKVLLISDEQAEKSAASLNVHVGSFQNPKEREGLAHFLEHMLFLGTEKYPEAGEYQAFIGEHGGQHNAYTSLEQTNYFFNVDAAHFLPTLDRFSQFFVAPRFDEKYVDRERHAVESEYRLKIKDDGRREWDVFSELLNPKHPLAKFSVGSLETLVNSDDRPIRKDLLAFYQRYYSANLMTLVVLGRESLDELELAVKSRFNAVVNRETVVASSGEPLFNSSLPMEVLLKPEKEKRELSLLFPIPSVKQHWQEKPLLFLGYLLGDEREGSFLAVLKAKGLVESLGAGQMLDTKEGAAFGISIGLTPQGVVVWRDVLAYFYEWLALVTEQGIVSWRYDEIERLQQAAFRFLEKGSPSSYVQQLSVALHDYPPQEVLRGGFVMSNFDEVLIRQLAQHLRADNALVNVVAPEFTETDRLSRHYGAPYQLLNTAKSATVDSVPLQNLSADTLFLPPLNPFLPTAFPQGGREDLAAKPVKLILSSGAKKHPLWFYSDTQFASPRASFHGRLSVPVAGTCQRAAQTDFYLALVKDQLDAGLYAAHLAGLSYGLARSPSGIVLELSGYADKQPVLLQRVLDAMTAVDWAASRFERVQAQLVRDGRNSLKQWPIRQVFAELGPLLNASCRPIELAGQLAQLTIDDMKAFAEQLFRRGHAQFYVGGALRRETAVAMAVTTLERLQLGKDGDHAVAYKVVHLEAHEEAPTRRIPVEHDDSGAVLYIQGHGDSLRERAHMALLKVMMAAPFYSEMRTEKKLGYVVGSSLAHRNRVPGLVFYIQSPVANAQGLQGEITGFFKGFESTIRAMSEADLQRYRRSVLVNLEEAPKNLGELKARHLESLQLDYEGFDFRVLLAKQVNAVTLKSLKAAYQRLIKAERRGLWVATLDADTRLKAGAQGQAQGVDHRSLRAKSVGVYQYQR